jgi:three-Cys-motif partner protein
MAFRGAPPEQAFRISQDYIMTKSTVGPWAAGKLDRLRKYLNAYTTIMKDQKWCEGYYYIDAFAGPGAHVVRPSSSGTRSRRHSLLDIADFSQSQPEQQQFLAGSPRIALEIEHPFTAYIFVERSSARVTALEELKAEYGESRRIVIRHRDCNGYLCEKVVANPKVDWNTSRALVFLDPFGMQVPWSTIELLGRTKAIEVFLNFPVGMAIQRLMYRDPTKFTAKRRAMLDDYFGSPDWFDIIYRTRRTLFDDETEEKIEQSGKRLLNWYRDRLKKVFGHVSKGALFRNTRGGHLYYLLLATRNSTGVTIANDVLSAGEFA